MLLSDSRVVIDATLAASTVGTSTHLDWHRNLFVLRAILLRERERAFAHALDVEQPLASRVLKRILFEHDRHLKISRSGPQTDAEAAGILAWQRRRAPGAVEGWTNLCVSRRMHHTLVVESNALHEMLGGVAPSQSSSAPDWSSHGRGARVVAAEAVRAECLRLEDWPRVLPGASPHTSFRRSASPLTPDGLAGGGRWHADIGCDLLCTTCPDRKHPCLPRGRRRARAAGLSARLASSLRVGPYPLTKHHPSA